LFEIWSALFLFTPFPGLHWVLEYYYRGVASWDWYYPYHYAPMASDLVRLSDINVAFTLGEPFLPFQQLLAVLPAASAKLLPAPFQVRAGRGWGGRVGEGGAGFR
jgi:5'-3' exonuclease